MDEVRARYRQLKWLLVSAELIWLACCLLLSLIIDPGISVPAIWAAVGFLIALAVEVLAGRLCCPKCRQPLGLRVYRWILIFRCRNCC